jgi:hypothetical protein
MDEIHIYARQGCQSLPNSRLQYALPIAYMYSALQTAAASHPTFDLYNYTCSNFELPGSHACPINRKMEISRFVRSNVTPTLLAAVALNLLYHFILLPIRSDRAAKKPVLRWHLR